MYTMKILPLEEMQLPPERDGGQIQVWEDKDRDRKIVEVLDSGDTYEMGTEICTPITELLEDDWLPIAFISLRENSNEEPVLIYDQNLKYKYIED